VTCAQARPSRCRAGVTFQRQRQRQRGITLIVALVLLVLLTLLGLTSMRVVTQEERMATASYDRSLAFQAAEAALRQAETMIETNKPEPATACGASAVGTQTIQVCPPPTAGAVVRWNDAAFTGWSNAGAVGSGALALTPQFFAEYLGNTFPCGLDPADVPVCKRYRITARGAQVGRANVTLQSVYATQ
jgi:type IV pilus assembly protein PilX